MCCDSCTKAFHSACAGLTVDADTATWQCPYCVVYYTKQELQALAVGTSVVACEGDRQWAGAIVEGLTPTHVVVKWTSKQWAHQTAVRLCMADADTWEPSISKLSSPEAACKAADKISQLYKDRPTLSATSLKLNTRRGFRVCTKAVGCRVSCQVTDRKGGGVRQRASGLYQASGQILCDCHGIVQNVCRFVMRCADNHGKRPYQHTMVQLGGQLVSLKELADREEGPLSGLAAGSVGGRGESKPVSTLKHKPKPASTLKHKPRSVPKGWTVPKDWAVEHRTRKAGQTEVVTAEFHVHAVAYLW